MAELDRLAELIKETTAARGVDVYAVVEHDLSATEWAEMTGRDRSTVSRNLRRADRELKPYCWECGTDLEGEPQVETAGDDVVCYECAGVNAEPVE